MRRLSELDEAVSLLSKLIESEGSKLVQRTRLRSLCRELKKGGPVSRKRMGQLIREISQALCDEFLKRGDEDDDRMNG